MTGNIKDSYNFRVINDRLTSSGVVGKDRLRALASQGYQVVINLLPDTSEHAVPDERNIVESQRLEYIHIPVDFARPEQSDFAQFSDAMDRTSNKKAHLHCAANYRVSAFYSLFAIKRGYWDVEQGLDFIHSLWRPADYPGWSEFIAEILGEGSGPA